MRFYRQHNSCNAGSENIVLKDMSGLKCLKTIEPFESSIVATLELHKDWKLKSKFRYHTQ